MLTLKLRHALILCNKNYCMKLVEVGRELPVTEFIQILLWKMVWRQTM